MRSRALFALTLALPLLAAVPERAPDEIRLVPREGLVLRKTFARTSEDESTSLSEGWETTSSTTAEASLVVRDVTRAADDDRVTELERTFEEVSSSIESEFEGGGTSASADCELVDETVTFEWDEDDEAYIADSDGADDDLIEDLPQDLDFTALLPEDAVEVDDEWELDLEAFQRMIDPWRGIPLDWGDEGGSGGTGEEGEPPEIETSEDGEITATFEETRAVDGVTVAVIILEGEIETEMTVDSSQESDGGFRSETHQESTSTRTIEGEVLWDLKGGHLHSLELEIDTETTGMSSTVFTFGDQQFERAHEDESEGTVVLTVSFEQVEEDE